MSRIFERGFLARLAVLMTLAGSHALAQRPASGYPAPRYPKFPQVKSADELMDIARVVVQGRARRAMVFAYGVKAGENVLMIVPGNFSPLVRDALARAIREAGAKLDIVVLDPDIPSPNAEQTDSRQGLPRDGTVEAAGLLTPEVGAAKSARYNQKVMAMAKSDRYDLVVEGWGGPQPVSTSRWEHIPWDTVEKFFSARFAAEIDEAIAQKVWDAFGRTKRIHIADPEGTDVTWSMKPGYMETLLKEWDDPIYRGQYDIIKRGHIGLSPTYLVFGDWDARGVVAGTINHAGVFPHTKVFLERGKVVRVEGGGRYGEAIQQVLKKYENVQYPTLPGPGAVWLIEVAMGTNPLIARATTVLNGENSTWERNRSGVIHFGLGASYPPSGSQKKVYLEKIEKENLPEGHFHIHTYFNTVDVETIDGKTIRVVDKGHITFLDDPEVRKVAAKYGNPDELLREAWIPAIPGVNVEGDYTKDYAPYPEKWIKLQIEQAKEGSHK